MFQDNNLESMQERMNFEKARIAEVNHQIKTLVESSEKVQIESFVELEAF